MPAQTRWKPSHADLALAEGRHLPDVIGPGLGVLFCGINPGLYSAAIGHHFGRPGNRFWVALHASGFTARIMSPWEDQELLKVHCGLTNLVERATARAAALGSSELEAGRSVLEGKVRRHQPRWVAILGIGAYRTAFAQTRGSLGRQEGTFAGAGLWVLPNPSGLNAHHQPAQLAKLFGALREAAGG